MTSRPQPGCAVILLPAAHVGLPADAIPTVRAANVLYAAADVDDSVALAAGAKPAPEQAELLLAATRNALVLLAARRTEPAAAALAEAGVPVIEPEQPPLLRAVAVMDRLRSPGGCPWDAEQTHDSLRQYLIEETYELLDAIETRDRPALLEELGDVLLQVLFHARLAAEDADEPFDIDDVAAKLVDKLVGRHPHVFADAERIPTAERQQHRWEELKQQEKQRESIVDGVALGQPAIALAAKLAARTGRANLPAELFPRGDDVGNRLFRAVAAAKRSGDEPEGELRKAARAFAADVRAAEAAARADDVDPSKLDAAGWRRYWPR